MDRTKPGSLRVIRIVFRNLRTKNTGHLLYFICVMVILMLPVLLEGISQTILNDVEEKQEDVYGEFTDLYYQEEENAGSMLISNSETEQLLKGFQYEEYGVIYNTGQFYVSKEDGKAIRAGYADDTAVRLGHIRLKEGRFPTGEKEIALCVDAIEALGLEEKLDTEVLLWGNSFKIVGIMESYGALWPKGYDQSKSRFYPINAFLDIKSSEELFGQGQKVRRIILIVRTPYVSNQMSGNRNFYQNQNLKQQGRIFTLPSVFVKITYVVSAVLLLSIYSVFVEKDRHRQQIYGLLGMVRLRRLEIAFCEYFILGLFGIAAGSAGSVLIYMLFLVIIRIKPDLDTLAYAAERLRDNCLFIFGIVTAVSLVITAMTLQAQYREGTNKKRKAQSRKAQIRKVQSRKAQSRKVQSRKIPRWSILCGVRRTGAVFILVLISVSAAQIGVGVIYKNIFENQTFYRELDGNMPFDYDLELFAKGRPTSPGDENTVYLENSYEKDGVPEELAREMEDEKTFDEVKKYKENNKVKIILDKGEMDEYLDIHDGIIDNTYFPTRGMGRAQELLGYGDSLLADTKLMGYSEEELSGFADYVADGEIDISRLLAGEEVILIVPAFIPEILENGMRMKFSEPDAKGAVNNSLIKAGDQIRLTALWTEREINGGVTEDELKKYFKRKDKTVTVGAIIPYNIGWFEKTVTIGEPYYLMTANEAFDKLGFPADYNRVRIYADDDYDYGLVTDRVNYYLEKLPFMTLEDRRTNMEAYKRLNRAVKMYTDLFMLLIIANAFVCIAADAFSRVRMNMRKISLFRINGMGVNRVIRIIWMESAITGLAGILLSIPLMLWLQEKIFGYELSYLTNFVSPWAVVSAYMIFTFLIIISFVPAAVYLKKAGIREHLY